MMNISHGTITGRFVIGVTDGPDEDTNPDVIPASGSVTFTPRVAYSPYAEGEPFTLVRAPIRAVLDKDGYLCTPVEAGEPIRGVKLFATDDGAVINWSYSVKYTFNATNGLTPAIPEHDIAVPTGSTQDLSDSVKVPNSPGLGIPQMEAAVLRAEAAAQTAKTLFPRWFTFANYSDFSEIPDPRLGDQYLYANSGDVMSYTDSGWVWGGNLQGKPGLPDESAWNALLARVEALENPEVTP